MDREGIDEIKRHFDVVSEESRAHDSRATTRLSYAELERRINDLESGMAELRSRMERVEARLGP